MIKRLPHINEWCNPWLVEALAVQESYAEDGTSTGHVLLVLVAGDNGENLRPLYAYRFSTEEEAERVKAEIGSFLETHTANENDNFEEDWAAEATPTADSKLH